jgi:hypothetical protein
MLTTEQRAAFASIRTVWRHERIILVGAGALGLQELFSNTLPFAAADLGIEMATVQLIVLLKMVAWLNRPADRSRDLQDLAFLFTKPGRSLRCSVEELRGGAGLAAGRAIGRAATSLCRVVAPASPVTHLAAVARAALALVALVLPADARIAASLPFVADLAARCLGRARPLVTSFRDGRLMNLCPRTHDTQSEAEQRNARERHRESGSHAIQDGPMSGSRASAKSPAHGARQRSMHPASASMGTRITTFEPARFGLVFSLGASYEF